MPVNLTDNCKWNAERMQRLAEMWGEGVPVRQVARRLRSTVSTVRTIACRHGLKRGRRVMVFPSLSASAAEALGKIAFEQNKSLTTLCERLLELVLEDGGVVARNLLDDEL